MERRTASAVRLLAATHHIVYTVRRFGGCRMPPAVRERYKGSHLDAPAADAPAFSAEMTVLTPGAALARGASRRPCCGGGLATTTPCDRRPVGMHSTNHLHPSPTSCVSNLAVVQRTVYTPLPVNNPSVLLPLKQSKPQTEAWRSLQMSMSRAQRLIDWPRLDLVTPPPSLAEPSRESRDLRRPTHLRVWNL